MQYLQGLILWKQDLSFSILRVQVTLGIMELQYLTKEQDSFWKTVLWL